MHHTVLLDGGVGTSLWEIAEERGIPKIPVWKYNMENPEIVSELHSRMIAAGAEIILANTFGANGPAVKRQSSYNAPEVVGRAMKIALESAAGTAVKVFLPFGPLSMLLEPYGDLEEDDCFDIYDEIISAGVESGAQGILIQTFMDVEMMRIAVIAAKKHSLPVFASMSFEGCGKTMMGNSVQDVIDKIEPLGVDAIGLNCSIGPKDALPIIKEFAQKTEMPIIFKPNSGKPIVNSLGETVSAYTAEQFAEETAPALEYVSYIGGCCGCNATYIKKLGERIRV